MDKTLDDLLHYLKTTIFIEDQNYIQNLNAIDIFFFCYGEEKAQIHNYTEPKLYLEKLYSDGYVNFKDSENTYQINLNGIEFINNGGYKTKSRNLFYKKIWNIIKVVAVFLNAIILLIFAYFSFMEDLKEAYKNNKKELKIENRKSK
ncbi:hypothetical protein [Chryseobacterium oryzae]|uniref:Uncharacterized protein n=1 Tax=Chryseobacterium oryzae TaxID=2929799 RepID=A0ABY4BE66_9FLAO|nr:hypothetical protein [Chryseobacterium oryzae]UOE37034.1 hypothetical protein MTP08_08110 [Chryseobacterium oryzae]